MGTLHALAARRLGLETYTVDTWRPADVAAAEDAPTAEIVAIATPIVSLADEACKAMRRGCERLLVEKPMAARLEEAEEVARCAEATGTSLHLGYTERFHPSVQLIKEELLGLVGPVRRLGFERHGPTPDPLGPGLWLDLVVHDIDLLHFLGSPPHNGQAWQDAGGVAATVDCGGSRASLRASYGRARKSRHFFVEGDDARIDCDLITGDVTAERPAGIEAYQAPQGDPLENQWRALLEARHSSADCGLRVLELALDLAAATYAQGLAADR